METLEKQLDLTRVIEDLDLVTTVTEASQVISRYSREACFENNPPTPERRQQRIFYHNTMSRWFSDQLHRQSR